MLNDDADSREIYHLDTCSLWEQIVPLSAVNAPINQPYGRFLFFLKYYKWCVVCKCASHALSFLAARSSWRYFWHAVRLLVCKIASQFGTTDC